MIETESRMAGMRGVLALIACLALAALLVAGCGSSSSTSTTNEPSSTGGSGSSGTTTSPRATEHAKPGNGPAKSGGSNGSEPKEAGGGKSESRPQAAAKAKHEESESSDQSIQQFGNEASGSEKSEVLAAMHAFIRAFGAGNFSAVCKGAAASLREQTEAYAKAQKSGPASCPAFLSKLVQTTEPAKAKRALEALVTHVRIKGDSAFVLYKPAGEPVSYFVLVHEDDGWKATSLSIGTPLIPGTH